MSAATAISPTVDPFEMTATAAGSMKEQCPAGNHAGICVGVIHAGTHSETFTDGKTKDVQKFYLLFETPNETMGNGQPFVLALEMNGSFGPQSNLRKLVEAWRGTSFTEGDKFSLAKLLGAKGMCNVAHKKTNKGNTVSNMTSVSAIPKGFVVPDPHYTPFLYTVNSNEEPPADEWIPYCFGQAIADVCRDSAEWKASHNGAARAAANGDQATTEPTVETDIPF